MRHRHLILIAALIMSGPALAVDSGSFRLSNAADLVALCGTAPDDALYANARGFCHGFLAGSYRYYVSTVLPENRYICSPNPTPTRTQVMNGFLAWANAHPQYMKDGAADTLFRYLAESYPCNK